MNIFGFTISFYSISIFLGIVVGYFTLSLRSKRYGIKSDHIDNLLLLTIPISIIGARLYHIIAEWSYYNSHLEEIFSLRMNGLGIFGAFIGGLIPFVFYSKVKSLKLLDLLDLSCLGLLAGQIVGRFGNFFNKELYGFPTNLPWGVYIPLEKRISDYQEYEFFHPTFFYESIWNLIGLLFALYLEHKNIKLKKGVIFSFYLIWYGIGRFLIGFLRIEPKDLWILNDGQIMSGIFIIAGLTLLIRIIKTMDKNGDKKS